jgi:hypothetical protein
MSRTVQIISMRSWGELGNLLAGRTLAATLAPELPGTSVEVWEAESLFPRFAPIGEEIRRVVGDRLPPERTRQAYLRVMAGLVEALPPGFEAAAELPEPLATEIAPLAAHLAATRPDVVVGTKGVISRLCLAALRRSGHRATVVNYVTNEGLLRLDVHRCPLIDHHLVQFERARRYLVDEHGYRPEQVRVVGRLLARAQASRFFEGGSAATGAPPSGAAVRRVLIFSNRGGREYLELLDRLTHGFPDAAVVFVAYNDPELAGAARDLLSRRATGDWQVFDRLGQGDYFRYLDWLAAGQAPLFISKTGPNAMLEGVYFGLPQLLLRSGLPMEEWVGPFLAEHGVGQAYTDMAGLIDTALRWLADPAQLAGRKRRALDLAGGVLDPQWARARTVAAFAAICEAARPVGSRR